MISKVTADAAGKRWELRSVSLRQHGVRRQVALTAGYNITATAAAVLARALGRAMWANYAVVTTWFGMALMIGDMGQSAALFMILASHRATFREDFAAGKVLAVLDEHQVRSWTPWHRWTILAQLAHAFGPSWKLASLTAAMTPMAC